MTKNDPAQSWGGPAGRGAFKGIFSASAIKVNIDFPDGVTERYHGGKLSGNVPKRCRNVSRDSGVLFSCKNDRNRLSGRVDLGKFGDFFQNLTAERWFGGFPGPENRN